MDRKLEIEKKINDIYSFNYANDYEVTEEESREIESLVDEGVKIGSPYAIKIRGMNLYWSWKKGGYKGDCPINCKEYMEVSARHGFGECMWAIADDSKLGFSDVERYAYRKAFQMQLEDLPYFGLDEEQLKVANELANEIEERFVKFYCSPEDELLIGSDA